MTRKNNQLVKDKGRLAQYETRDADGAAIELEPLVVNVALDRLDVLAERPLLGVHERVLVDDRLLVGVGHQAHLVHAHLARKRDAQLLEVDGKVVQLDAFVEDAAHLARLVHAHGHLVGEHLGYLLGLLVEEVLADQALQARLVLLHDLQAIVHLLLDQVDRVLKVELRRPEHIRIVRHQLHVGHGVLQILRTIRAVHRARLHLLVELLETVWLFIFEEKAI